MVEAGATLPVARAGYRPGVKRLAKKRPVVRGMESVEAQAGKRTVSRQMLFTMAGP